MTKIRDKNTHDANTRYKNLHTAHTNHEISNIKTFVNYNVTCKFGRDKH